MKIRGKLIAAFLIAGLAPAVTLFVLAWNSTKSVEVTLGEQFEGIAINVLDKVERNLFERYGDVQAFGYNTVILEREHWHKPGDANPIVQAMNKYVVAYGMYPLMVLVDPTGKVIAVNSADAAGKAIDTAFVYEKNFEREPWFQAAMSGRFLAGPTGLTGTVVDDVYVEPMLKQIERDEGLCMGFTAPVMDASGKTIAVWRNYAKWSVVEDILADSYQTMKKSGWPNGELTLLDRAGRVIVDCDPGASGKHSNRDMDNVILKLNLAAQGVEAAKKALSGESGSLRSLHSRKQVWQSAAYKHSTGALGYPGMGWSLLVRVPEAESLAAVHSMRLSLETVMIGAVPSIALVAWFFAGMIVKPIRRVVEAIKDVAQGEGDLTKRIDVRSNDEVGELAQWFNMFLKVLNDLIAQIAASAQQVGTATQQIDEAGRGMADTVNEQAQQTQQTSSAIEEMSASIIEVARKAGDAAGGTRSAGESAQQGGEIVKRTVAGIRGISRMVEESSSVIEELGKRGEQIGSIIEVINDIADQTNLLALNAAIEAARAGEHGRGFAVVADEVRKLAERTVKATKEVSDSISAIQSDTTIAVGRMGECSKSVAEGVKLAEEAGEALDGIVGNSGGISSMVEAIAAATEEQSAAAEEITRSVSSIAEVGRRNSEQASQVASAATTLSEQTAAMLKLVGRFKTSA